MKKVALVVCLALTACSLTPLRVFQAKVPAPVVKPLAQVESERRAADFIARKLFAPESLKPLALSLSTSLGAPERPIIAETPEQVDVAAALAVTDLQKQLVAMQKQLVQLNLNLTKYQGKEIDGTGLSLLGPGMVTIIVVLIVLGVVFPPAFTFMAFAYRRMKAVAGIVVDQVEQAAESPETKAAVGAIKTGISKAMGDHSQSTSALKNIVLDLKKV